MHIAYVTAGGAGMFCGSCMQDNALARALIGHGCEVSLIPTYTPIRVDQINVSQERIFLGGINLYLDNRLPGWRYLPRFMVSWLDRPNVIRWATSRGIENDAQKLGDMTLAMLDGADGAMRREYRELIHYLTSLKPDVIVFTNALLSGVMPLLRREFSGPILCLLQGDDLFLDQLSDRHRPLACQKIAQHSQLFDRFITHSHFYADYMAGYLQLPRDKFLQVPLAIDVPDLPHITPPERAAGAPVRIGYFARIAPEKGLLPLVEAVLKLHAEGIPVELHAGGYLGPNYHHYLQQVQQAAAPLGTRFQYIGSPVTQQEKLTFLKGLDIFSVPVTYVEPKGLYALEALAMGVPVVLPASGSLTELVASTRGGLLFEPGQSHDHADRLRQLILDPELRQQLASRGRESVLQSHSTPRAAETLLAHCQQLLHAK